MKAIPAIVPGDARIPDRIALEVDVRGAPLAVVHRVMDALRRVRAMAKVMEGVALATLPEVPHAVPSVADPTGADPDTVNAGNRRHLLWSCRFRWFLKRRGWNPWLGRSG